MSTHKKIDIICCIAVVFALLVTVLFLNAEALGIQAADKVMGYEKRLFDETKVHTVDIVIDDWDAFLTTCQNEEYSVCNVLIDGEAYTNVGIRGKGNTSLSTVSSMDSNRYSFKIEFDQYDNTKSYYGLDKLCLNNIIQDNTYMKDFLAYQLMEEFGVDAPLCSYVYITVNGEDWGLYLAVEGIEDGFLQRNYGSDYGELYKPDSMSFGGGRGNGKDFNMEDFDFSQLENFGFGIQDSNENSDGTSSESESFRNPFGDMFGGEMPDMSDVSGGEMPDMGNMPWDGEPSEGEFPGGNMQIPEGMESLDGNRQVPEGRGSSDVKLQYIDDNASSYSNIFNNAKTEITEADEQRLIASLKALAEGENIESVVDVEEVIRYFVVHNFLVNGDSYTGSMIHNYYLYEEDGQLSMIPWDYNLAYGTFSGSNASSSVNESIDEVLSDRPMQAWIFSDEEYSAQYYALYAELLETVDVQAIIDNAYSLIAPYVEKDPTAFCTYEEFEKGVEAIKSFCALRRESVALQLSGSNESVSAEGLNISDMGTMGGGMGGGFGGEKNPFDSDSQGSSGKPQRPDNSSSNETEGGTIPTSFTSTNSEDSSETDNGENQSQMPWGDGELPNTGDFDINNIPEGGMQFPGNMPSGQIPNGNSQGGSLGSANTGISVSNDTIMLIVSVAVLAGGLIFAVLFKRRK